MFLVAEDVREAVLVEDSPLGDDADVREQYGDLVQLLKLVKND